MRSVSLSLSSLFSQKKRITEAAGETGSDSKVGRSKPRAERARESTAAASAPAAMAVASASSQVKVKETRNNDPPFASAFSLSHSDSDCVLQ